MVDFALVAGLAGASPDIASLIVASLVGAIPVVAGLAALAAVGIT